MFTQKVKDIDLNEEKSIEKNYNNKWYYNTAY